MTLYKVLDMEGRAIHGSSGKWNLPKGDEPGEWMPPVKGEIVPCKNGYHLTDRDHLPIWLGPTIYEAEGRGDSVNATDKTAFRDARLIRKVDTWNERTARLFAADCAEHVLPIFETKHPNDDRPRKAIKAARQFARGEIDRKDLDAARAAARDAAWAFAGASAMDAAGDAARDAARAAARASARAAARDAARAAAWDAAMDAARDAAGDAARAAAWAAAMDAARAAERAWQTARLFDYLEGRAE